MMPTPSTTMVFTLRRKQYTLSYDDVVNMAQVLQPRPLEKYSVTIDGREFPPKQLIAETLQINNVSFTTMDANRILEKLGFTITDINPQRKMSYKQILNFTDPMQEIMFLLGGLKTTHSQLADRLLELIAEVTKKDNGGI